MSNSGFPQTKIVSIDLALFVVFCADFIAVFLLCFVLLVSVALSYLGYVVIEASP